MAKRPVSQALIDRLISFASDKYYDSVRGMSKLHRRLNFIRQRLCDVENKITAADKDGSIKDLLRRLIEVARDAEDYFHKLEARRCEILDPNKVNKIFHSIVSQIGSEIKKINRGFRQIIMDLNKHENIIVIEPSSISYDFEKIDRETYLPLVDDSIIVGWESETAKIVDLLTDNSSVNQETTYSIIDIIGGYKVGKTTFAKMVFDRVSFDSKKWLSVAKCTDEIEKSNRNRIFNMILKSINAKKSDFSTSEVIDRELLEESLETKRHLIVLDDALNDGTIEWDYVLSNLSGLRLKNSKFIVARRNEIDFREDSILTQQMPELLLEDCHSLFEKIAFGDGGVTKTDSLTEIGKEIVSKCGGLPLAAKLVGSFLYSKQNEDDWLFVRDNKIWDDPEGKEKLMGILKLRYDYLAPSLKECLSYCFVAHKDLIINKNKLIQSWMAEGLLPSSIKGMSLDIIGKEYFNILLCNSFFKAVKTNASGEVKLCKIYDLIHDLAPSIIGAEGSTVDVSTIETQNISELRRIHLVFDNHISTIPQEMYDAKKLRTFSYTALRAENEIVKRIPDSMCLKLQYLRVLDLSRTAIRELPHSIGELKHLHYLDVSNTKLQTLPDSVTKLCSLQTLRVKSCDLQEFPREMRKLIHLRHLINSNSKTGQPQIPCELRKLSCLQTLSAFSVGNKDKGFGIAELNNLDQLEGKLQIHNLENVLDETDAPKANLKKKGNIRHIEMYWWKHRDNCAIMGDNACAVLNGLQPQKDLKILAVHNFPAMEFPTWLYSVDCLPYVVSISLLNCYGCETLHSLGRLPYLEVLHISGMRLVNFIGDRSKGSAASTSSEVPSNLFPSLKQLHLIEMRSLEHFEPASDYSCFPHLKRLKIDHCSKLSTTPSLFPSLEEFEFSYSNGVLGNLLVERNLKTLTSIEIASAGNLEYLPQGLFHGNGVLQRLEISQCDNFVGFRQGQEVHQTQVPFNSALESLQIYECSNLTQLPSLQGLVSLRELRVVDCRQLTSLPDGMDRLVSLEYLHIGGYSDKMESLPDQLHFLTSLQHLILESFSSLVTLPEWLGNFVLLRKLVLRKCQELKNLPSEEQMLRLTMLDTIQLQRCPVLERSLYGKDSKIAHVLVFQCDNPQ